MVSLWSSVICCKMDNWISPFIRIFSFTHSPLSALFSWIHTIFNYLPPYLYTAFLSYLIFCQSHSISSQSASIKTSRAKSTSMEIKPINDTDNISLLPPLPLHRITVVSAISREEKDIIFHAHSWLRSLPPYHTQNLVECILVMCILSMYPVFCIIVPCFLYSCNLSLVSL